MSKVKSYGKFWRIYGPQPGGTLAEYQLRKREPKRAIEPGHVIARLGYALQSSDGGAKGGRAAQSKVRHPITLAPVKGTSK
jgi:hypothetical protein